MYAPKLEFKVKSYKKEDFKQSEWEQKWRTNDPAYEFYFKQRRVANSPYFSPDTQIAENKEILFLLEPNV
jgi:hypothetical protein